MKKIKIFQLFSFLVICISLFVTAKGLMHLAVEGNLPNWQNQRIQLCTLIGTFFLFFVLSIKYKYSPFIWAMLAAIVFVLVVGQVWSILSVVLFVVASICMGNLLTNRLKIAISNYQWVYEFLIGAGIYGTITSLIAAYPINYPGLYFSLLVLPIIIKRQKLIDLLQIALLTMKRQSSYNKFQICLDSIVSVLAIIYFAIAFMPEVGFDALTTHLFVPSSLYLNHIWKFNIQYYVWTVMPMLADWIYAVLYMIGGELAARLINIWFIIIIVFLLFDLVKFMINESKRMKNVQSVVIILYLSCPLMFLEASSLFIESVWSAYIVSAIILILRKVFANDATNESSSKIWCIAGVLLGVAFASKLVTLCFVLPIVLVLLLSFRFWLNRGSLFYFLSGIGGAFIFGIIPYLRAYMITGNPVFPFFNGIFKSVYYPATNFEAPAIFDKGIHWDTIYNMTFQSSHFLEAKPGAAGFAILFLLPITTLWALASKNIRAMVVLFCAILATVIVFHSTAYLRYIMPSYVLFIACIGIILTDAHVKDNKSSFISQVIWGGVIFVSFLNILFFKTATYFGNFSFNAVFSDMGRKEYLLGNLPIREAIATVNELNLGNQPVAIFASAQIAGLKADALLPNWYNYKFADAVNSLVKVEDVAKLFSDYNIKYVILDTNWGSSNTRSLIESATDSIIKINSIEIRVLKPNYKVSIELIKNPTFLSTEGWSFDNNVSVTGGELKVSVNAPAVQAVKIQAGHSYVNTVKASCLDEVTEVRMQINWMDAKGQFIKPDIQVFKCNDQSIHSMYVTAPENAAIAMVYCSGHTSIPVVFRENSLKND